MTEPFKYDVFLSHSAKDKPAVRELATRLKADGLRVWLDEWEIKPGDMIGLKINQGLEQSRTLVLVMSANASESEWVTFESQTIRFNDPTNKHRRFIPLRLDDAEINDTLKQFAYVDWRQKSDDQYANLLAACSPPVVASEQAVEQNAESAPSKVLKGHTELVFALAITSDGRRAVSGSFDKAVRVWELPPYDEKAAKESEATQYTNAKVLLVGDSGVGKSGLAYRLTENRFEPTISTDAAWATQLSLPHDTSSKEIEREIWLWDFAGQADYRLIHQLFLDSSTLHG